MNKSQEDLIATLEDRRLFKALIEEEYEVNHGPSKRCYLLYLKARATTDCTIRGRRYSICFGCSAQHYRVTADDMANWGCPGVSEDQIKRWTKAYRDDGMIATHTRRSNKRPRGTQIALVNWSKWHGKRNTAWPEDSEGLQAAAQRASAIRERNRSLLPLRRGRPKADHSARSQSQPGVAETAKLENSTSQTTGQDNGVKCEDQHFGAEVKCDNRTSYKDKVLSPKILSNRPRKRDAIAFHGDRLGSLSNAAIGRIAKDTGSTFADVIAKCHEAEQSAGGPIGKPIGYLKKSLAEGNPRGQPEGSVMPVAEVNPELLEILRRRRA